MMIYGYARCSTNETKQDIQRQTRELKAAGAEQIYLEYEHGDSAVKEQLSTLLETAQAGDTILTLEVSRLGQKHQATLRNHRNGQGQVFALIHRREHLRRLHKRTD